jgi:hypothetical protein
MAIDITSTLFAGLFESRVLVLKSSEVEIAGGGIPTIDD